jgi:CubicO group peptidase (beta-lactamase class C family)
VEWLSQNHLTDRQRESVYFDPCTATATGGLMRVLEDPAMISTLGVAGEFGWDGWTGPYMSVCPKEDMILLLMMQRTESGTTELARKIRNIVYSRL